MSAPTAAEPTPLTDDQHRRFLDLACRLSPESLHSDGEVSRAVADRRYREAMREWRALEKEVGRAVDEGEIWRREFKRD